MPSFTFLYRCMIPKTIIDIYTTNTSIAEEMSEQGATVTARRIKQ